MQSWHLFTLNPVKHSYSSSSGEGKGHGHSAHKSPASEFDKATDPMNSAPFDMQNTATPFSSTAGNMVDRMRTISPTSSRDESSLASKSLEKPVKVVADKQQEKKKRRKKKWKKPKDKPNRPLSAYNLFFQSERALMLGADAPTAAEESLKKRVHCKTHGKIGFADLARAIGAKWKSLESEIKQPFLDKASKEKERYSLQLATWKEAQKEKNIVEAESNGLDTMATAAMVSDPIDSDRSTSGSQSDSNKPSDSLRLMMADEVYRRNISMLQQRPQELDYLRALQDRQVDRATLFGLSQLDSSLLQYPNAAEASANAILQHFQGIQQSPPSPRQTAQSHNFFEADRFSQLTTSFPAKIAAMQRLQRYKMSNGSYVNEYGLCI
jgi:hypothetical protein